MPPGRVIDTIRYSVELHTRIQRTVAKENERRLRLGEDLLEKRTEKLVWLIEEGLRAVEERLRADDAQLQSSGKTAVKAR